MTQAFCSDKGRDNNDGPVNVLYDRKYFIPQYNPDVIKYSFSSAGVFTIVVTTTTVNWANQLTIHKHTEHSPERSSNKTEALFS